MMDNERFEFCEGLVYNLVCAKCHNVVGVHVDTGDTELPNLEDACCYICPDPQNLEWIPSGYGKPGG